MRYVLFAEKLEAPAAALPSLAHQPGLMPFALLPARPAANDIAPSQLVEKALPVPNALRSKSRSRDFEVGHSGLEPETNGLREATSRRY
jgi:hypothetical protein